MENNENIKEKLNQLVAKIPVDEQLKFYKHLAESANLREDDSMYVLLLSMGYIKTMYEDIPNAMQVLDESIEKKARAVEEILDKAMSKFKAETELFFKEKREELMEEQFRAMSVFAEGAREYMDMVDKQNKNTDKFIQDKQTSIRKMITETTKEDFPKIVNQHLKHFIEESTNTGWKNFAYTSIKTIFLITCGILFSDVARSLFQ